jgi:hypothetical protein
LARYTDKSSSIHSTEEGISPSSVSYLEAAAILHAVLWMADVDA